MAVGQVAADAFSVAMNAVASATKQSVGAAFDQVREVQNASFAFKAYEHDAGKVNQVLSQLVAFARSDMGVLFQREELFKAASNLRAFGVASDEITDKVKILARGVSLGMTTFDELSQIIGRVIQKGRLDANEFDMLAQRGIVLSSSFRGAKVSSKELFDELSRVLPADLLTGRANTIDGMMIRLQSAFRDLGSSILGVDANTSQFIKGGLGDTAMNILNQFTDLLKDPDIKQGLKDIGNGIAEIAKKIMEGLKWAWENVIKPFGKWWKDNWPAISKVIQEAWAVVKPVWDEFVRTLKEDLWPEIVKLYNELKPYIPLLGIILVAAIALLIAGLLILAKTINGIIFVVNQVIAYFTWMSNTANNVGVAVGGVFNWLKDRANDFKWAVIDAYNSLDRLVGGGNQVMSGIRASAAPHRALGGPVVGGNAYMVGENGPELFVPNSGGTVVPNGQGSSPSTINITVQAGAFMGTQQDARKYATMIGEALKDIANAKNTTVMGLLS